MSNLDRGPEETPCGGRAGVAVAPVSQLLPGSAVALGGPRAMTVTRTLPHRDRRMVGPWCFVDFYGPADVSSGGGMRVPPHPHSGLQTVSWLVAGEVLHRDSLGNTQLIRPRQLNLMTAGRGISHSEETPAEHSAILHGLQLWTALPSRDQHTEAHFEHHSELPVITGRGTAITVIMGELDAAASPARSYSPLVGAEVELDAGSETRVPLRRDWEYSALVLAGIVQVDGVDLRPGPMLYLGCGRSDLSFRSEMSGRVLLLGGEPFDERIVMWWNFVGRDHDEIVDAREQWMNGRRFGTVHGYAGDRLPAPPMPTVRLKPRGRSR